MRGGRTVEDDDVVRGVDVQALAERERPRVVGERRVRGRVVQRDGRVREPRDELLHVPDAERTRDGRAERGVVPEVEVDGVVEALPLLRGEQLAELGVAERDGLWGWSVGRL